MIQTEKPSEHKERETDQPKGDEGESVASARWGGAAASGVLHVSVVKSKRN